MTSGERSLAKSGVAIWDSPARLMAISAALELKSCKKK